MILTLSLSTFDRNFDLGWQRLTAMQFDDVVSLWRLRHCIRSTATLSYTRLLLQVHRLLSRGSTSSFVSLKKPIYRDDDSRAGPVVARTEYSYETSELKYSGEGILRDKGEALIK